MTSYKVNQYLAANGVTVTGNTDAYYRLKPDGIKAWYVDGVAEPTEADLAGYPDVDPVVVIMNEIARLENLETPRRLAEAVLTVEGKAWLEANRALIAVERAKL
jgi:hypothetical protein